MDMDRRLVDGKSRSTVPENLTGSGSTAGGSRWNGLHATPGLDGMSIFPRLGIFQGQARILLIFAKCERIV
jgi:hypothetical protein